MKEIKHIFSPQPWVITANKNHIKKVARNYWALKVSREKVDYQNPNLDNLFDLIAKKLRYEDGKASFV